MSFFQIVYFKVYEEYVNNYPVAVETIHKYQENEETKHLLEVCMDLVNYCQKSNLIWTLEVLC